MSQPPPSDSSLPAVDPGRGPAPFQALLAAASAVDPEEAAIQADDRFRAAVAQFNAGEWYACHDGFEELWHETRGACRRALQGILQIAVAHLHLERGNQRGATVLLGEGLGRLRSGDRQALGLDLDGLCHSAGERLGALQRGEDPGPLPLPRLQPAGPT